MGGGKRNVWHPSPGIEMSEIRKKCCHFHLFLPFTIVVKIFTKNSLKKNLPFCNKKIRPMGVALTFCSVLLLQGGPVKFYNLIL